MSYEPTNWKKGDKVTSARLNKIEQGIQGNDTEVSDLKEGFTQMTTATASDVGKALKAKTVTDGKVTEWEFGETGGADPEAIEQAVTDWLDDHPEATTTVEDNSLTINKMVIGTLGFVTPEMFGAVGDGVTDDSVAFQSAVNACNTVHLTEGKTYYLASAINITNDIVISGHNATIKTVATGSGAINNGLLVRGTLKAETTLTTNYVSKTSDDNAGNKFTLADMSNVAIGDILCIKATDQYYAYTRQYYYLGATLLVTDIYDGHIYTNTSMPFDITLTENVSVDVYSAPTAQISDINFVGDLAGLGSYNALLYLQRCKNAIVQNCTFAQIPCGLTINQCVNTLVSGVTLSKSKYSETVDGDGYGITVSSSTNTVIDRVVALCSQGCVDLGGTVPNIDTYITHCNLMSESRAIGIDMHENSYNIVVEDCVLGGVSLYGTAKVNRCRFVNNLRPATNTITSIIYRGSHNAEWSTLEVTNCEFVRESYLQFSQPSPQNPIQAIDAIIGRVLISNCNGEGVISFTPSLNSNILSSNIKSLVLKDCYLSHIYRNKYGKINELLIENCSFNYKYWISSHTAADGTYLVGIDYVDFKSSSPATHKIAENKTSSCAERLYLPNNTTIDLSSTSQNAVFRICGKNLVSNESADYRVGSVAGAVGSQLSRTIATDNGVPTVHVDENGNIIYTQSVYNMLKYAFYPIGMFYVPERSNVNMKVTVKNVGETDPASFYPYIAVVDCATGLLTYRGNGTSVQASTEGTERSFSKANIDPNSTVLCYFYCNNPIQGAVTSFENYTIELNPSFGPELTDNTEEFKCKRLVGDGTLQSYGGVNNIMCSENSFAIKFVADYVNNPIV